MIFPVLVQYRDNFWRRKIVVNINQIIYVAVYKSLLTFLSISIGINKHELKIHNPYIDPGISRLEQPNGLFKRK